MQFRRIVLLCGALVVASGVAGAVDFDADIGFAPRFDGTFSSFLGGTVYYSPAFYSAVSLEYETEKEEEEGREPNLTTTAETETDTFSVDLDWLGYNFVQNTLELGLAGSVEYLRFAADEELEYQADPGFEIVPGSGSETLLLTNDRTLNIVLPTLDARYADRFGPVRLQLGGEYAPVVFVRLEQTADTEPVYPGFTDEGAVSTDGDYWSDQSFSANGNLAYRNPILSPSVGFEYTHLPIEYDIAAPGGEQTIDTLIRELALDGAVTFSVVKVAGFSPKATVRYDRSWTEIDGQDDVEILDEWLFFVGVERTR